MRKTKAQIEFETEQSRRKSAQRDHQFETEAREMRLAVAHDLRSRLRDHTISIAISANEARFIIEELEK